MRKLGAAIIGTGNIAPQHVAGYLAHPERVEIKVLCDIFGDKAEKFAAVHGLEDCEIVTDYHELLGRDDIDLVSLCLPPSVHAEAAIDFMNAGKDVICEKPMAASLEEADRMNETAQRTGRILAVISQNRYRNNLYKVKKILDTGMLGRILFVKVNSFWYRGTNYYTLWWRGTWDKEGGGCTLNHAVHQIDILNYLMGKPLSITSVMANLAHDNAEIEDISLSLLRYPNALAEVNVTLCNHDERQEFEIVTEKATITVPWSVHAVKQLPNGFFEANPEMEKQLQDIYDSIPDLEMEGHPAEIGNVLKAIAGEEDLLIDGKAGKDALDVIYGIYESAVERREVTLPIPADSPFYTKEGMLGKVPVYHEKSVSVDNIDGDITLGRN